MAGRACFYEVASRVGCLPLFTLGLFGLHVQGARASSRVRVRSSTIRPCTLSVRNFEFAVSIKLFLYRHCNQIFANALPLNVRMQSKRNNGVSDTTTCCAASNKLGCLVLRLRL